MERSNQIVIGGALGAAVLAGGLGYALGAMRGAAPSTPAAEPGLANKAAGEVEALLRAKDEEIERLSAANLLLEARFDELASLRRPAGRAAADDGREPPAMSGADASGDDEQTRAWLNEVARELAKQRAEGGPELLVLDLRGKKITDADLAELAAMGQLGSLSLRGTAITDAGLAHLRGLVNLESLELRGTEVTGEGLAALPTWKLKALHLTDTKVTGEDLFGMPRMASLQTLKLNRLAFGDEHVNALAAYPSVRHLELDGTALTDAGLRRLLAQNPLLTRIELRGTAISSEAAQELVALYPDCELVLDNGQPITFHR